MKRLAAVALVAYLVGRREGLVEGQDNGFRRAAGIFAAGVKEGKR